MTAFARRRGSISIAFALMLASVLAFAGLALDMAQLYSRKQELQQLADAVALAAAQSLNGTAGGIDSAVQKAGTIAAGYHYAYIKPVAWNSNALSFAASADATGSEWQDVTGATASPAGLRYVRVDTSKLDGIGDVATPFSAVLGAAYASASMAAQAVAGRSGIEVAPLAVCAMSATPDAARANGLGDTEWVQYGFRHGVSYNLLNLNPAIGATTPEYFLVAPQAGSTDTSDSKVGPYLCSGTMARDTVTGATVTVGRPGAFTLSGHLNTRFDVFPAPSPCTARGTPPDTNIKSYAVPNWMAAPTASHAQPGATGAGQKLDTVADRTAAAATTTAASYGALWVYGAAKRFAGAHDPIAKAQWQYLYPVGGGSTPAAAGNLGVSPYLSPALGQSASPVRAGRKLRRLVFIPLLACPVAAGASAQAQVLAVARFLLTAPASATAVSAEFAGVVSEQSLGGMVELYQ